MVFCRVDQITADAERRRTMAMNTRVIKTFCWLQIALCIFAVGAASAAFAYGRKDAVKNGQVSTDVRSISNIMVVLEKRNTGHRVLEKAEEKLRTLDDRKLRLMSSLCDHVSVSGDTAGADIAFSLITAMIVLS